MKLPFSLTGCSGSGYHYSDAPFEIDENDIDRLDDALDASVYSAEDDFTEYLWMENEEEFDKLEWQRLEEEELMEQCMENMLADVLDNENINEDDAHDLFTFCADAQDICQFMSLLGVNAASIENSSLNPLAKEFVPSSATD